MQEVARRHVLLAGVGLGAGMALGPTPEQAQANPTMRLAANGRTDYRILVGTSESAVVQHAARELAHWLSRVTGAEFPVVVADSLDDYDKVLVVGTRNGFARRPPLSLDGVDFGEDGFVLRSLGQSALIAGAVDRGTLYGVYWVLDRLCGVRWYSPDYTKVPNTPTLTISRTLINGDHVARYRYRCILARDIIDPQFRQRLLLNGRRDYYWTTPTPPELDTWSSYWPQEKVALVRTLVPDQQYWYNQQILFMDQGARDLAVTTTVRLLQERMSLGEDPVIGVTPMDNIYEPADPASQAFAGAHGDTLAAPLLDFVNHVAEKVAEQIPNARLETLAYLWSLEPPTGMTVNPNVVITIAPAFADRAQSLLSGPNNVSNREIYDRWSILADDVVTWDYIVNFQNFLRPMPSWWASGRSIQEVAGTGTDGYFANGANAIGAEMVHLRAWVNSRLLWDPDQDVDALIEEFTTDFYGPAGAHVYAYLKTMAAAVEDTDTWLMMGSGTVGLPFFTFETMHEADQHIATAIAAVRADSAFAKHVREVRLSVDMVVMWRRADYLAEAASRGVKWDIDYAERRARFVADADEAGVYAWNGHYQPLSALLAILDVERAASKPPDAVTGLPADQWSNIPDYDLRAYAPAPSTILADPLASDAVTIRFPGNREVWAIQYDLSGLPPEGSWRVVAQLRADAVSSANGSFAMGIYPPITNTTPTRQEYYFPVSDLVDGQYHDVEFPATVSWRSGTTYLYITGLAGSSLPWLYVDRLYAVRIE